MGRFAIVIVGPAGSGKTTLCSVLAEHYANIGRSMHICNFDPAAEEIVYEPSFDIRELISLEEVMEAKGLGPNGGLVYCMEYLIQQPNWLLENLGDYGEDFICLDMPGQVEVFSHIPVVPMVVKTLQSEGYMVVVLFLLDAITVTSDISKFISGCMFSLSSMVTLDCPFINILSKCDLIEGTISEEKLENFCLCDFDNFSIAHLPPVFKRFSKTLSQLINDFQLVSFRPINIRSMNDLNGLCQTIDEVLQYGDDAEVNDKEMLMDTDISDNIAYNPNENIGV